LPPARVGIENTENEFVTEHKGIFYAESPFPDFCPIFGYRDLQNIQSDRNFAFGARLSTQFPLDLENIKFDRKNAFGACLSTQFPPSRVGIENTENEFLM